VTVRKVPEDITSVEYYRVGVRVTGQTRAEVARKLEMIHKHLYDLVVEMRPISFNFAQYDQKGDIQDCFFGGSLDGQDLIGPVPEKLSVSEEKE
jgi:hypothetical protein